MPSRPPALARVGVFAVLDDLRVRAHRIEPQVTAAYGGYQAIWRDPKTGVYAGATEMRKDGCALGY